MVRTEIACWMSRSYLLTGWLFFASVRAVALRLSQLRSSLHTLLPPFSILSSLLSPPSSLLCPLPLSSLLSPPLSSPLSCPLLFSCTFETQRPGVTPKVTTVLRFATRTPPIPLTVDTIETRRRNTSPKVTTVLRFATRTPPIPLDPLDC